MPGSVSHFATRAVWRLIGIVLAVASTVASAAPRQVHVVATGACGLENLRARVTDLVGADVLVESAHAVVAIDSTAAGDQITARVRFVDEMPPGSLACYAPRAATSWQGA